MTMQFGQAKGLEYLRNDFVGSFLLSSSTFMNIISSQ